METQSLDKAQQIEEAAPGQCSTWPQSHSPRPEQVLTAVGDDVLSPSKWICFFNASLQIVVEPALAAAQQIAKSTWNGHLGTARLFAEMLRRLTSTECKTNLNASVLLLRVAPTCPEGQHQDAQEYLQLLFECIDKAWCNPFCVQMQSSIQCCFCGHSSQPAVTAADFMVPMDVRASVQDAIDAFSEPSHQSAIASDRYRCPRKCPRSSALALKDAKLRHPPLRRWSQTRIDLSSRAPCIAWCTSSVSPIETTRILLQST